MHKNMSRAESSPGRPHGLLPGKPPAWLTSPAHQLAPGSGSRSGGARLPGEMAEHGVVLQVRQQSQLGAQLRAGLVMAGILVQDGEEPGMFRYEEVCSMVQDEPVQRP